jgi:16S rRNA (guanine966-N2)-methyltransferase
MRIIAGEWRGRRLTAPAGATTRPTADRARETLFSMLTSRMGGFSGLRVADLFAGSGALGLEALSRGAAHCIFVERDRAALAVLRDNIAALGAVDTDVRAQAVETLGPFQAPLDLVMMDPPYGDCDWPALTSRLIDHRWIGSETVVTIEGAVGSVPAASRLVKVTDRKVGKAMLSIFQGFVD